LVGKAELIGHGLSFTRDSNAILKSSVAPPEDQKHKGAFQDVATATRSPGLESSADLGALWAGNPDLQHVPIPDGGEWARVLSCVIGTRTEREPHTIRHTTGGAVITQLELPGETGADLDRAIAKYPTLIGARALQDQSAGTTVAGPDEGVGRVATVDGRMVVPVAREAPTQTTLAEYWNMQDALYSAVEIDETYPLWPHPHLVGYVQPSIGGGPAPSPLMLWWALLLGLSSLARYYPAAWVRAIDLETRDGTGKWLDPTESRPATSLLALADSAALVFPSCAQRERWASPAPR
jgi:hypothetical protein